MPDTAVTAEIHQPLDVHRDLAAEITLDREAGDDVAEPGNLGLAQILDLRARIDARLGAGLDRTTASDTVNMGQRNRHVLVDGYVDSGNTCHSLFPWSLLSLAAACAAGPSKSLAEPRDA